MDNAENKMDGANANNTKGDAAAGGYTESENAVGGTIEGSVPKHTGAIPKVGSAKVSGTKFKARRKGRGRKSKKSKVSKAESEMSAAVADVASKLKSLNVKSTSETTQAKHTNQNEPIKKMYFCGVYKCIVDPAIFIDTLSQLNLEHCELTEVPPALLELKNIVSLDLSSNLITHFNETPMFIHTLEELSLQNNYLVVPPLWIWKETPRKLKNLNLSKNQDLVSTLKQQNYKEYLNRLLNIEKISLYFCRLHLGPELLYTIIGAQELILGGGSNTNHYWNELYEFPVQYVGCIEARIINVNNCKIYDIHETINYYSLVTHLDIGHNYIVYLPEELGDLTELEVLIMSCNKIRRLPKSIVKMEKLRILFIDNNVLDIFPGNSLVGLPNLKSLDMYENYFNAVPKGYEKLDEFDISENYIREPEHIEYTLMKTKLRSNHVTCRRTNATKYRYVFKNRAEKQY